MILLKEFIKYTSLNVLGMIGLSCYILADTFFVSKGLGSNGLAALNLAIPIYSLIHGSGLMIGIGGGIKYSIKKSQKIKKEANYAFTHAVFLAGIVSVIFFLIGSFCSEGIAGLWGTDAVVFEMSKTYLQVILWFAPVFIVNNVLLCFIRNDGAPQLSMAAMLIGSLSNIILDYIFIFPFKMGIFGAVLATGLAPVISILVLLPYFLKKQNHFHFTKCKLSWKLIFEIFASGIPSFVTEISGGIVMIVFNIIILKLLGNIGVAAYGIIANISLVVTAIYTGIAQGIQPIISAQHSLGNPKKVRTILRYAVITAVAGSAILYCSIFFGAEQISSIFNSESNALLQNTAVTGMKIYFTASLFAGLNIILSAYFTSKEIYIPAHIIAALRGFFIILPLAFWLSEAGGIIGVWLVYPITELLVCMIAIYFYQQFKRRLL